MTSNFCATSKPRQYTRRIVSSWQPDELGDLNPQSWNGYAYARNNPLRFVGPDGREYEICGYTESGGGSCGKVSDQYFAQLQRNPGAGLTLWNGWIFATVNRRQVAAGTYRQTSIDPTFNDFIGQTGVLADAWLKAGATEMAKNAAAVGVGASRWGVEAGTGYLEAAEVANAARLGA